MANPPLLPQVNLDDVTNNGPITLPATDKEVADADAGSVLPEAKNAYSGVMAQLANSPIRYDNAGSFFEKTVGDLINPNTPFRQDNKLLTPDEANKLYGQPGMAQFTAPIYEQSAQIISDRQAIENHRQDVLNRSGLGAVSGTVNNIVNSTLSMADPLSVPMYFIPIVGEEALYGKVAGALGKSILGRGAYAGTRLIGEMTRGSIEQNITDTLLAPPQQAHSIGEDATEDFQNIMSATFLGLGLKSFGKALGEGVGMFKRLSPDTQQHFIDSMSSEKPIDPNVVLSLDKNIAEVEAQLGIKDQSAADRAKMMADPNRPKTSEELLANGDKAGAAKVAAAGDEELLGRTNKVRQDVDAGKFDDAPILKTPEVEPTVKPGASVAEQEEATNKLLIDAQQGHRDLLQGLDPEKDAKQINALNDGVPEADEEINRVQGQKPLLNSAIKCAMDNGL